MKPIDMRKIKTISIIGFLAKLGYQPSRRDQRFSYYQIELPHLQETIKVSHRLNKWRDTSGGTWKDIVALGMLIYGDCNIRRVIDKIKDVMDLQMPSVADSTISHAKGFSGIVFTQLTDEYLLDYFLSRSIPAGIAKQFCSQATFRMGRRMHKAIAFPNSSGGYVIVGEKIRCRIPPHDVSVFNLSADYKLCYVFLTFIDFLSFVTMMSNADFEPFADTVDYIVLNSASNLSKADVWLDGYEMISCCLPNDSIGKSLLDKISSSHQLVYDISKSYSIYATLNDMLCNINPVKHLYSE